MDTVAEAISDLTYAFQLAQEQLAGLTEADMTGEVVDSERGCTVRDIMAHLTGWADYVLDVLPVMLSAIDVQLPPVDVEARNREALAARAGQTTRQIADELERKHRRILELLHSATPEALTMRRTQQDKIFTIKSYVVDVMKNHILEAVEPIKRWRAGRERKPWVRWVLNHQATGLLKKEYDKAIKRAGRVWNIVRVMSLRPAALKASMQLYGSVVQQSSAALSRAHREMIAVVVSQANHCHY